MDVEIQNESVCYNGFTFRLVDGKVTDTLAPMRIGDKVKASKEAVEFCQWAIDNEMAVAR